VVVEAAVAAGLPSERAVLADDKSEAVRILRRDLAPSDVVLVKASRGLALDTVAEQILILDGR
jgi:UDP-N-acetylmuramoyl-tripeptide--D-alanyl-D-alanine ligase